MTSNGPETTRSTPLPRPPHPSPLPLPHPPLPVGTSPRGRGGAWGKLGHHRGLFFPRPCGERVPEGRVRGLPSSPPGRGVAEGRVRRLPAGQSAQSLFESGVVLGDKSHGPGVAFGTCASFLLALVILAAGHARADGLALIIGVNECPDFRLPDGTRPRPLQGAENDATALADFLVREAGFARRDVMVLKGPEATRDRIKSAFDLLAKRARAEDHLVIHYSGHGTQVADVRPFDEPDGRDEALCPWDATADGANLLLDDDLGVWLDRVRAGRVTVILDCCHAGTGTKDVAADREIVSRFLPMKPVAGRPSPSKKPWRELQNNTKGFGSQLTGFFACQPDQEAYERRFLDHQPPRRAGQFSHFFIEGLQNAAADQNRDGIVSHAELLRYVSQRLDESFNRTRTIPAGHQNPAMETDSPDAAVLIARRKAKL